MVNKLLLSYNDIRRERSRPDARPQKRLNCAESRGAAVRLSRRPSPKSSPGAEYMSEKEGGMEPKADIADSARRKIGSANHTYDARGRNVGNRKTDRRPTTA
jgi:hypothetical protein